MDEYVQLLSRKRLSEFSPEEYKSLIRSLYKERKKRAPAKKKPRAPYSFRITKKGKLSLKVNRSPKWISSDELTVISQLSGFPESEVFILLKKKEIRISTEADEKRIAADIASLPF